MSGRIAIVTGGLTGIGLASAAALVHAGHRVAVGSRRGETGEAAEAARAKLGKGAFIGALDVADPASVAAFLAQVEERFGPAQILVNAAGIYREGFLDSADEQSWDDQVAINLTGSYRMIRALFPAMKAEGWGRIANIASTAGRVGAAGYAGYCASKAGVVGLSKAVAVEGAAFGISCISISPTWVETPMMNRALERHAAASGGTVAQAKAALHASNPQNRLVQPEEVAALVAFFCSPDAPALTNEDIQVNAGALW
jgi:NAD(P)-dependent dehydrogenase (short-subunit alcohol dehydrogenase family)